MVFVIFPLWINAQPVSSVVLDASYSTLGIKPRIENDGIFGIKSFDISQSAIALTLENNTALLINSGSVKRIVLQGNSQSYIFDTNIPDNGDNIPVSLKTIFTGSRKLTLKDEGGQLSARDVTVRVQYVNRSRMDLTYNLPGYNRSFSLDFPGDLACADFIGIEQQNNSFILIEKYISEIPLQIERFVYCLNESGELNSVLKIPAIKYMSLINEFRIDAEGNFYHLITNQAGLRLVRWSGLTVTGSGTIEYPAEYNYRCHYNDFTTNYEYESVIPQNSPQLAVSRLQALRIGETYVYHRYNIVPANLAVNNTTAPDGDIVRTPAWLVTGRNARVPYKWGGFNTLSQINDGLAANKFAGDIHTDGVSSYAVGVDCSGFVSRCWQLTYHASI